MPRYSTLKKLLGRTWVPVLLILASFGVAGGVTLLHSDALSPVDEWVYVDYLYKLPSEGLVRQGEPIGHQALDIMACDGVRPYGPMGPACGTDYSDASKFPFAGVTSADAYTPVYFAITRVVGDVISTVGNTGDVTGWRLTGPLWLAATMLAFWALLKQWRVRPITILGLGLAFIASPFAWWTYTYISTDAPSVFFGALLLYCATRFVRGTLSGWWMPALSVLMVVVKVSNILAVCLVALYLLAEWFTRTDKTRWTQWRTWRWSGPDNRLSLFGLGVISLGSAAAAQVAWLVLRKMLTQGESADQAIAIPLTAQELASQTINFLPGTITANVNISGSTDFAYAMPSFVFIPLAWICVAGVVGAFWTLKRGQSHGALTVSVALAAVFFAPLLAVMIYVSAGSYFPLPPRYGAPILAGFLLVAGISLRNRWAAGILLAYAVALTGVVVAAAPHLA